MHCAGVQSYCSSIWKVPKSGSGSRHVWRTVHLHQVGYLLVMKHIFLIKHINIHLQSSQPVKEIIDDLTVLMFTCYLTDVF